ncbi:MAG: GTPase HflX [Halobacteriovoraceae bacterium]|nr:GTPase HflX [Halobacteriovoraceae bacterium]|tara:strand:- start:39244 stop:40563 length:1320 start_codon:yes stop_codon:yes gene_type:complete
MNQEEYKVKIGSKAALVSIVCESFEHHSNEQETQAGLSELRELLRTLGIEAGKSYWQKRKQLDPGTMLGVGKLEEIAEEAKRDECHYLVFDFELSASQIRNIQKITGLEVIDRVQVILEIFAHHARTRDAKIQIEISRLQYMLPRLQSLWTHFTKQRGGTYQKGEGEQQLELDRRIIRRKIETYKKQLEEIAKSREQQKKRRQNQAVTAALVGYTNAGKSSLMNKLCKVDVLSENMLFATLDSTYRTLNPDTKPPMILIDTVGFIQNLPSTLVQGFKTTLESAMEADLLIIVCDLSDPNYKKHLKVTEETLSELNLEGKDQIIVFTKKDKVKDPFLPKIALRNFKASFLVSAFDDEDISNLRQYIVNYFLAKQEHFDLFIPYEDGAAQSKVLANCNVIKTINHEQGIFYRIKVPDFIFHRLNLKKYILAPDDPRASQLH